MITPIEPWRRGPRKHVARRWHGPSGTNLKCDECGWDTGHDGTIREKEDRFRAHRTEMGEIVKPQRAPSRREQLAQALRERDEALAQLHAAQALPTGPVDRCPRCLCGNCGGRLDEHRDVDCECENCALSWMRQCSVGAFETSEGIDHFTQALGPWLSSHLNERMRLRCLYVAHAAHHALRDYDKQKENNRA